MNLLSDKVIEYGVARDCLSVSSLYMEWRQLKIVFSLGFIVLKEQSYFTFLVTRALVYSQVYLTLDTCGFSPPNSRYKLEIGDFYLCLPHYSGLDKGTENSQL